MGRRERRRPPPRATARPVGAERALETLRGACAPGLINAGRRRMAGQGESLLKNSSWSPGWRRKLPGRRGPVRPAYIVIRSRLLDVYPIGRPAAPQTMAKPRGGGAKPRGGRAPRGKAAKKEEPTRTDDVYEAEDSDADWEKHASRFDVSTVLRRLAALRASLGHALAMNAAPARHARRRLPAAAAAAAAACSSRPRLLCCSTPTRCSLQKGENYEYEMPSDFEDEDIDDEMAFTGARRRRRRRACRRTASEARQHAARAWLRGAAAGAGLATRMPPLRPCRCSPARLTTTPTNHATEEDKKMFGHLFDDAGPAGGADGDAGASDGSLLSSGESGDEEEGGSGSEGWSEGESEGEAGGRGGRRRQADELDELFGEVRSAVACWQNTVLTSCGLYPAPATCIGGCCCGQGMLCGTAVLFRGRCLAAEPPPCSARRLPACRRTARTASWAAAAARRRMKRRQPVAAPLSRRRRTRRRQRRGTPPCLRR